MRRCVGSWIVSGVGGPIGGLRNRGQAYGGQSWVVSCSALQAWDGPSIFLGDKSTCK
jgi:hypothetical protein